MVLNPSASPFPDTSLLGHEAGCIFWTRLIVFPHRLSLTLQMSARFIIFLPSHTSYQHCYRYSTEVRSAEERNVFNQSLGRKHHLCSKSPSQHLQASVVLKMNNRQNNPSVALFGRASDTLTVISSNLLIALRNSTKCFLNSHKGWWGWSAGAHPAHSAHPAQHTWKPGTGTVSVPRFGTGWLWAGNERSEILMNISFMPLASGVNTWARRYRNNKRMLWVHVVFPRARDFACYFFSCNIKKRVQRTEALHQ